MNKPVINLDELEMQSHEESPFKASYGIISDRIGAKKLGYSLSVVPPGKKVCPYHNHHINEEMFFVIEGTGLLRFGEQEYPLRKFDVIACPPGKRDVAHQIVNTGKVDLKYLSLSTREPYEVCEYPDSNKVGIYVGEEGKAHFRHLFKIEHAVDYFEGEEK
jgi:uncharacterized cupin superfamily protein